MLELAVFLCGAVVMVIELAGSRVMAPYLGTSLVVWTSLIGIILAALSLGCWWGGRLADRRPEARLLGRIILLAALATGAIGLTNPFVLGFLQAQGAGLHTAAVWATLVLFAPPALCLGMVAPFAVRLKLSDARHSGRTAGSLYAISTVGSIVGTFLAGFVLIAWIGSTNIMLLMAAVLVLASFLAARSGAPAKGALLAIFLALLFQAAAGDGRLAAEGFVDTDTPYNRVLVYSAAEGPTGRLMRVMATGPGAKQSAMYLDSPAALALAYTRYFRLVEHFAPQMRRLLVLGGGGFSFPKYALENYPRVDLDVVELDPGIVALAREHFGLKDHPRQRIIAEDARTFLNRNQKPYDAILCDTFNSHYAVPFHLATQEAARRMKSSLAPNGVVLVNLISALAGERGRLFCALHATYASVFPRVLVFAVSDPLDRANTQNIIIAAFASAGMPSLTASDPQLDAMLARWVQPPAEESCAPLTDEFAPVDRYTASVWR
ncbi:MAG: fused MFS/spermidine synthase [Desulfobacterales bacterium]|jgi:spermidine synthase|nr:fused MFS/spermidine synthase [Desulfobacterales bacterium]